MDVTPIAKASADAASGNPSCTHGLTLIAGDVLVIIVNMNGASNTVTDNNGSTPCTPDDFTDNPDSARFYVFHRVCGSSEPAAYNFTAGTSNRWSMIIGQYRNVDPNVIWDVAPSSSTRGTNTLWATAIGPDMTISTEGSLGLELMGDDAFPTTTTFTSINNGYGNVRSESGQQYSVMADKSGLPIGSTGATEITSSANVTYVCYQVALKPITVIKPVFIAAGAQTATTTIGATLSPAVPAGNVGDLLVCQMVGRPNGSTITNTFSNTWTLAGSRFREIGAGATDLWVGVYLRIAGVGEASPTITPDADFLTSSTTGGVSAQIARFRFASDVLDVAAAVNDAAAAATWTPPAVTPNSPYSLILSCVGTSDDNALNFNTANSFAIAMGGASYDTTVGSDHAVGMAYYVKEVAGLVTMPVWNESAVGNDPWVGVTLALRLGLHPWQKVVSINQAVKRAAYY